MLCEFDPPELRDGLYHSRCNQCGFIDKSPCKPNAIYRNCPNAPDVTEAAEKLGISVSDIKHWAQALAKWKRAGYPTRSQAEITRIEQTTCQPCDEYVSDDTAWLNKLLGWLIGTRYGRCKVCGCGVSTSRVAVANKIAMATESCKLGKWKDTA